MRIPQVRSGEIRGGEARCRGTRSRRVVGEERVGVGVEVGDLLRENWLDRYDGCRNVIRESVALLGVWRWEDISWVGVLVGFMSA